MANQKRQVQIRMWENNGNPFVVTLHNVLWAPDLCNSLCSIITLMHSGHTWLFHKEVFTVYFVDMNKNAVALPKISQKKHAFLFEIE